MCEAACLRNLLWAPVLCRPQPENFPCSLTRAERNKTGGVMWNFIPYAGNQMMIMISSGAKICKIVSWCNSPGMPGEIVSAQKGDPAVPVHGSSQTAGVLHWTKMWTAIGTSFFGHSNFRQFLHLYYLKTTSWKVKLGTNVIFVLHSSCKCDFLGAGCAWAGFSCFEWYLFDFNKILNLARFSLLCWGFGGGVFVVLLFLLFAFGCLFVSRLPPISPWDLMSQGAAVPANTLSSPLGLSGASPLSLHHCGLSFWSQDTVLLLGNNISQRCWISSREFQPYQTAQPFVIVCSQ